MPDDMSNGSKNDIVNLVTPSMLTGNKRRNERGSIHDIANHMRKPDPYLSGERTSEQQIYIYIYI